MADNKENKAVKEMATKKPENKIQFFNEKKWIMAYWFGTHRVQFTENALWDLWCRSWGNDFNGKSDERFQDIVLWIKEVKSTMSKDEIKKKRREVADCQPMPEYIKKLAAKKGYYVKKCSTRKHPSKVSGYAIFKNKKDKKAVYGKKFELTAHRVKQILEAKENK